MTLQTGIGVLRRRNGESGVQNLMNNSGMDLRSRRWQAGKNFLDRVVEEPDFFRE